MTSQNEQTPVQVKRPRDPDMIGAEAAMHRAAQKARRKSFEAGLPVAVFKDGKVVLGVGPTAPTRTSLNMTLR